MKQGAACGDPDAEAGPSFVLGVRFSNGSEAPRSDDLDVLPRIHLSLYGRLGISCNRQPPFASKLKPSRLHILIDLVAAGTEHYSSRKCLGKDLV